MLVLSHFSFFHCSSKNLVRFSLNYTLGKMKTGEMIQRNRVVELASVRHYNCFYCCCYFRYCYHYCYCFCCFFCCSAVVSAAVVVIDAVGFYLLYKQIVQARSTRRFYLSCSRTAASTTQRKTVGQYLSLLHQF